MSDERAGEGFGDWGLGPLGLGWCCALMTTWGQAWAIAGVVGLTAAYMVTCRLTYWQKRKIEALEAAHD